jgi:hypothetical protein
MLLDSVFSSNLPHTFMLVSSVDGYKCTTIIGCASDRAHYCAAHLGVRDDIVSSSYGLVHSLATFCAAVHRCVMFSCLWLGVTYTTSSSSSFTSISVSSIGSINCTTNGDLLNTVTRVIELSI